MPVERAIVHRHRTQERRATVAANLVTPFVASAFGEVADGRDAIELRCRELNAELLFDAEENIHMCQ